MKLSQTTSVIAISALLATAGVAAADSITSAFEGSVSVLSPDQTGFIIGGQVSVNGLGSAGLTMTRSIADMTLTGSASSDPDTFEGGLNGADADADILSVLRFSREISTSGSLVGQGNVVSRGEAIAAMGSAGAASASTEIAGVRDTGLNQGEGSATAEATSQGSLNGSLSTSNSLQLLGTSGLFAGSNALTVGEENTAVAYGSSNVTANSDLTGVQLTGAYWGDTDPTTEGVQLGAAGDGALFLVTSDLTDADNEIALSVSNAGNGTISITTSTGGFFTGGGAAGGSSSFVNNGSFFGAWN